MTAGQPTSPSRSREAAACSKSQRRGREMNDAKNGTRKAERTATVEVYAVLYRVEEAAAALRLSRWTVYELIRSGRLRTVKQGNRRLVPVAALHEYVALLESEIAS